MLELGQMTCEAFYLVAIYSATNFKFTKKRTSVGYTPRGKFVDDLSIEMRLFQTTHQV